MLHYRTRSTNSSFKPDNSANQARLEQHVAAQSNNFPEAYRPYLIPSIFKEIEEAIRQLKGKHLDQNAQIQTTSGGESESFKKSSEVASIEGDVDGVLGVCSISTSAKTTLNAASRSSASDDLAKKKKKKKKKRLGDLVMSSIECTELLDDQCRKRTSSRHPQSQYRILRDDGTVDNLSSSSSKTIKKPRVLVPSLKLARPRIRYRDVFILR